uniref:Uncharacterized protein n=1 Tax=Pipistrellus kuhlii TaxID=59472 RepID=A0A7J7X128_PIPKU|nr:hypothetical protein mPipKuh1_010797 [Pipistrellus kuhlii]
MYLKSSYWENITLKPKSIGIIDRKCLKSNNMPLKLREGGGKDRISLENSHQSTCTSNTGRNCLFSENEVHEDAILKHSCGWNSVRCEFCLSLNFSDEKPSDGKFTGCCIKGEVCPNYIHFPDYPAYLKRLMTN